MTGSEGKHPSSKHAGFTLLEVMLAVAIMAMISTVIFSAFDQTARTREVVTTSETQSHEIMTTFAMLTEDLASAYLTMNRSKVKLAWDTVFIGTDSGTADRLDFASFSHRRMLRNSHESDQAELSYYTVDVYGESRLKKLMRREAAHLDLEPKEGGHKLILLNDVLEFNLSYYDRQMLEWLDEWDTTQATGQGNRLPEQVRIRILIRSRNGQEKEYVTQTPVMMTMPLLASGFVPGTGIMDAQ